MTKFQNEFKRGPWKLVSAGLGGRVLGVYRLTEAGPSGAWVHVGRIMGELNQATLNRAIDNAEWANES